MSVIDDEPHSRQSEDTQAPAPTPTVNLLTGIGFLATAASFITDVSVTDIAAVSGGLISIGVVTAGGAAIRTLIRRRSLSAKVDELREVRHEIEVQKKEELDSATVQQFYEVLDARIGRLEKNIGKSGWRQGIVFAVFGLAVAVLVVMFGSWIPTIK